MLPCTVHATQYMLPCYHDRSWSGERRTSRYVKNSWLHMCVYTYVLEHSGCFLQCLPLSSIPSSLGHIFSSRYFGSLVLKALMCNYFTRITHSPLKKKVWYLSSSHSFLTFLNFYCMGHTSFPFLCWFNQKIIVFQLSFSRPGVTTYLFPSLFSVGQLP